MEKKAFLVSTTFMSRVVVDVDDNGEIINWNNLVSQVEKSIRDAVNNSETDENIDTFSLTRNVHIIQKKTIVEL